MKILVCVPSYLKDGVPFVSKRTLDTLCAQKTTHVWDYYVVVQDVVDGKDMLSVNINLAAKLNMGRDVTLREGYDAMFWLSADNILVEDVIEKLASFIPKYGVVSAPFRLRPTAMNMSHIAPMSYNPDADPKVGMDLRLLNDWYIKLKWGIPFEAAGGGLPMISREVLEKVYFRQEPKPSGAVGADIRFFTDAYEAGYNTLIVPVQVGHLDGDKELWLDEEFYTSIANKIIRGEMLAEMLGDYSNASV